jgi:hypothetical protein
MNISDSVEYKLKIEVFRKAMSKSLHDSNISDSFASYCKIENLNDDREDDRNDDHICADTWLSQVFGT